MADKSSSPLKVLIAGAGIGGLAVAVGLRQEGHDVHITRYTAQGQVVATEDFSKLRKFFSPVCFSNR
ncbi:MAG: hypothetical protein LQ346_008256 [Caloplaca aetnensis]|nr:MAG: hypothetical protein LQ346_008256 [Caloplaca aetnensis]